MVFAENLANGNASKSHILSIKVTLDVGLHFIMQIVTSEGRILRKGYKGRNSRHWKSYYSNHVQILLKKHVERMEPSLFSVMRTNL